MSKLIQSQSGLVRLAGKLLFVAGLRNRLIVLIYHRVLPRPDPMFPSEVDAMTFGWQMELLSRYFTVLPLGDAIDRLYTKRLPARAVCVTFDDGYADNHDVAMPILKRLQLPATFFVTTGYLQGEVMWNDAIIEAVRQAKGDRLDLGPLGLGSYSTATQQDRANNAMKIVLAVRYHAHDARREIVNRLIDMTGAAPPRKLMMSEREVASLAKSGMEIGGHTVTHPILTRITDEQARAEIHQNKEQLEAITGNRLRFFAYPNGCPGRDYERRHIDMVKQAGYAAAVSTAWGAAQRSLDRYQIPRLIPWDNTATKFGLRLVSSYLTSARLLPAH